VTFLDPAQRLTAAEEYSRYLTHENNPQDPSYRHFLARVAVPLLERLPPHQRGLDYGCGPGPALAMMLREAGHTVSIFDPFFFPDPAPLNGSYDFITCTEALEHFCQPMEEFQRFQAMLAPGGLLALMTSFLRDDVQFATWRYRRDPTHVVFYREETLDYVAGILGWSCEIVGKDVALMHKPA
jgi:SAM-dependent methyltransferase